MSDARILSFERAVNFRDMGGYLAEDGRQTRWHHLFRSGHLGRLTQRDVVSFAALGIHTAYDLRSDAERLAAPSVCYPRHGSHSLAITTRANHDNLIRSWIAREMPDEKILSIQDETYREIVAEHGARYGEMFASILHAGGRPFLIHCAGGKDRTGIAAALMLHALGVSENNIYDDYLHTLNDPATILWTNKLAKRFIAEGGPEVEDNAVARAVRLFGVTRERLKIAFDTMKELSGSPTDYLYERIGLESRDVESLKRWYLE
jgi:protein-tyrosine phosphatase